MSITVLFGITWYIDFVVTCSGLYVTDRTILIWNAKDVTKKENK